MSSEDVKQIVRRIDYRMWWTIVGFCVTTIIGGTVFYKNVEANTNEIEKAKKERAELKESIENIERNQILTTSDVKYLREDMIEQKTLLKQVLEEIRQR